MRYISSGHSHGEQITIILDGIPSNLELDLDKINEALYLRKQGFGRSERMNIEFDKLEIVSGVLFGKTTGAPICIVIKNKDYENHKTYMHPFNYDLTNYERVTTPRPGHADLVGAIKYQQKDLRVIIERASARETISRVAVGAICAQILNQLDINYNSYVTNIGGIELSDDFDLDYLKYSQVRMPSKMSTEKALKLIEEAKQKQDTLGGICQVEITNVPIGLGSYVNSDTKLDGKIAQAVLSIQSCKGVEFGEGFKLANKFGSKSHDEIIYDGEYKRKSNHYGGFEGGMTNGMPIIVRAVFKPIPTLMKPLESVNIDTKEKTLAHIERSDVCAISSASVICMYTVIYEVTNALLMQFTSDTMEQLIDAVKAYREYVKRF
ncbi:MAG TPA: chorismate synthase [Haloplasmataceae bacterium]